MKLKPTDVEWITNNLGELGVKIGDQMFFLYKGCSLEYENTDQEDDEDAYKWRPVEKYEFGATCEPVNPVEPDSVEWYDMFPQPKMQPLSAQVCENLQPTWRRRKTIMNGVVVTAYIVLALLALWAQYHFIR